MCRWESQILGRDGWKKGENWKNCHFSSDIRGNHSDYQPERIEAPFSHVFDLNSPSSYVKCPRKCQKTYNFDIFVTLSQIYTSPPPKFWDES